MRFIKNADKFPLPPDERTKEAYLKWGSFFIDRSQGLADTGRFAVLYLKPLVTVATTLTGAGGAAAVVSHGDPIYGWAVVILSAVAGAANSLFTASSPETLYRMDRAQQILLWGQTTLFKQGSAPYDSPDEATNCLLYGETVRELTQSQVIDWSKYFLAAMKAPRGKRGA